MIVDNGVENDGEQPVQPVSIHLFGVDLELPGTWANNVVDRAYASGNSG